MKFAVERARGTKDVDFLLNVSPCAGSNFSSHRFLRILDTCPFQNPAIFSLRSRSQAVPRICASNSWLRKNSNAKMIFGWIFRTACMPAHAWATYGAPRSTSVASPTNNGRSPQSFLSTYGNGAGYLLQSFGCATGSQIQLYQNCTKTLSNCDLGGYFEREADSPKLLKTLKRQSNGRKRWNGGSCLQSRCSPS
jgi:hypothetical protein